jgi:hypothetical protein
MVESNHLTLRYVGYGHVVFPETCSHPEGGEHATCRSIELLHTPTVATAMFGVNTREKTDERNCKVEQLSCN